MKIIKIILCICNIVYFYSLFSFLCIIVWICLVYDVCFIQILSTTCVQSFTLLTWLGLSVPIALVMLANVSKVIHI